MGFLATDVKPLNAPMVSLMQDLHKDSDRQWIKQYSCELCLVHWEVDEACALSIAHVQPKERHTHKSVWLSVVCVQDH
jgi:hypothetical protein